MSSEHTGIWHFTYRKQTFSTKNDKSHGRCDTLQKHTTETQRHLKHGILDYHKTHCAVSEQKTTHTRSFHLPPTTATSGGREPVAAPLTCVVERDRDGASPRISSSSAGPTRGIPGPGAHKTVGRKEILDANFYRDCKCFSENLSPYSQWLVKECWILKSEHNANKTYLTAERHTDKENQTPLYRK